jgi:hypothetical protein
MIRACTLAILIGCFALCVSIVPANGDDDAAAVMEQWLPATANQGTIPPGTTITLLALLTFSSRIGRAVY